MSKTDLAARPMFVRTRDAIEAHLTIVFTALAVARETQNRTGLAIRNVIRQLRPLRSATIAVNGAVQAFPPAIDPEQQKILDDLKNGRDPRVSGLGAVRPPWPRWSARCRSSGQLCCGLRVRRWPGCGPWPRGARPGGSRRTTKVHGHSRQVVLGRISATTLRCGRLPPLLLDYKNSEP